MVSKPYFRRGDWVEPESEGHEHDGQGKTFETLAYENGQKDHPVKACSPDNWEFHKFAGQQAPV